MQTPRQFQIAVVVTVAILTSCRKVPPRPQDSATRQQATVGLAKGVTVPKSDERSCKEFVQNFYDWYVQGELTDECTALKKWRAKTHDELPDSINSCERASKLGSAKAMSLKQALSPKLNRLLDEDAAAQAKEPDEITGLDGDPFLNGNGGAIYDYIVGNAQMKGEKCYATVNEVGINGNQEKEGKIYDRIVAELSNSDGKWMIDNIHYNFSEIYDPAKNANVSYEDDLVHQLNVLGDK